MVNICDVEDAFLAIVVLSSARPNANRSIRIKKKEPKT